MKNKCYMYRTNHTSAWKCCKNKEKNLWMKSIFIWKVRVYKINFNVKKNSNIFKSLITFYEWIWMNNWRKYGVSCMCVFLTLVFMMEKKESRSLTCDCKKI